MVLGALGWVDEWVGRSELLVGNCSGWLVGFVEWAEMRGEGC